MNKTNHPLEQEEVMAYLDGELPTDRASTVAAHLERCGDCQGVAADFQGVSRRLMAWQVESAGTGVSEGLTTALDERVRKPKAARTWRAFLGGRVSPWGLGLVGVSVALLLVVSLVPPLHKAHMRALPALQVRVPRDVARIPMIARTSQLTLTTSEFDKSRSGLEDILKRHSGYVGQLNTSAPTGAGRVLEAVLRVPADQLEAVMSELKKLGRVESESQTGEEVTQQYIDLEARLSNARNAEQRLTDILRQRTGKLADVLAVELEIDRVRGEIERMDAEKKNLTTRVTFATVTVKIAEDYKAELHAAPDSTPTRFRNAAVEGYRSMVEGVFSLVLFLLSYGPSLLVWGGLLFLLVLILRKRLRRA